MSYPAGTKCVITWKSSIGSAKFKIGDIVTADGDEWPAEIYDVLPAGISPQDIMIGFVEHPDHGNALKWTRPLEDPDKTDIPEEEELTV